MANDRKPVDAESVRQVDSILSESDTGCKAVGTFIEEARGVRSAEKWDDRSPSLRIKPTCYAIPSAGGIRPSMEQ